MTTTAKRAYLTAKFLGLRRVRTTAEADATFTVVLIDAAGDDVSDGDFVHVEGVTIADLRDSARWQRLRRDLLRVAEEIERRDRPEGR